MNSLQTPKQNKLNDVPNAPKKDSTSAEKVEMTDLANVRKNLFN